MEKRCSNQEPIKANWTFGDLAKITVAVRKGRLEELKSYVERGFPIDYTHNTHTICFFTAYYGQSDCLEYIIKKGADVNRRDKNGFTPAHIAASKGHLECLQMLGNNGANLASKTIDGQTCLSVAKKNSRMDCVEWLESYLPPKKQPKKLFSAALDEACDKFAEQFAEQFAAAFAEGLMKEIFSDRIIPVDQDAVDQDQEKAIHCPAKHTLSKFTHRRLSSVFSFASCDVCKVALQDGSTVFGCRKCNWDICESCVNLQLKEIDPDHFSPRNGQILIDFLSPFLFEELGWTQADVIFTLIVSFLIDERKKDTDEHPKNLKALKMWIPLN